MYLTYGEYLKFGGTLDYTTFTNYEFEAEGVIDWYTFDRLTKDDEVPEAVKRCMVNLIELTKTKNNTLSLGTTETEAEAAVARISAQSNDGVSVSFATITPQNLVTFCKDEVDNVINHTLRGAVNKAGRKLLYRGLYPGE